MIVKALNIYPVKSCYGRSYEQADVETRGLAYDRRYMIVDENGRFLTLRTHPAMTQIYPFMQGSNLFLKFGLNNIKSVWDLERMRVLVWNDYVDALVADEYTNRALSDFLGETVRLVAMDENSQRRTNKVWADTSVSFADGYPLLIVNTASLEALSISAGRTLSMDQFRPNIIIETQIPWAEDEWKTIRIGDVVLDLVKPCTRCIVTTLNPDNGQADFPETMQALVKLRQSKNPRIKGVLFGVNATVRQTGKISVGMTTSLLA